MALLSGHMQNAKASHLMSSSVACMVRPAHVNPSIRNKLRGRSSWGRSYHAQRYTRPPIRPGRHALYRHPKTFLMPKDRSKAPRDE